MQHLQRVGKIDGPIFTHLWAKVYHILGEWKRSLWFQRFSDCINHVTLQR